MSRTRTAAVVALALALVPQGSQAQIVVLEDAALGFSMELGPGWTYGRKDNGYVVGHESIPGLVAVLGFPGRFTEADLMQAPANGYRDQNLQVTARVPLEQKVLTAGAGKGLYYRCQGVLDGTAVTGFLAWYLGPDGHAVLVVALTTPPSFPALEPAARTLLESVRISAPAPSPAAPPAPVAAPPASAAAPSGSEAAQWKVLLTGKKLTHLWAYSSGGGFDGASVGGSSERYWHLCPDGSYWATGSSMASADAGGASGLSTSQSADQGRWEVEAGEHGPELVLRSEHGAMTRYRLSWRGRDKYMGNMKFFATEDVVCR